MPYVSRKQIALTREEVDDFLRENVWGRLATAGLDLEPHLTPLGYVYYDGAIWFHGLRNSRRGRQIAQNPKVAFLVDDGVAPGDHYTQRRGVIVYGRCQVAGDDARLEAARAAYMRGMGMTRVEEVERRTHDWCRIDIDRVSSWDFRKIPVGSDRKA